MKSITIHGLDDELVRLLRDRAVAEGTSVNRVVKRLLEQALVQSLDVRPSTGDTHRADFQEFCGMWSASELEEFERVTADTRTLDGDDRA